MLKVIIILVILNVVAGLWYVSLCIENSGESYDMWLEENINIPATMADTVADVSQPDTFDIVTDKGFFQAKRHASVDGERGYPASSMVVKANLPRCVNGSDSLDLLIEALTEKAFGHASVRFDDAMHHFVKHPVFVDGDSFSHYEIDAAPGVSEFSASTEVLVYPLFNSDRLLVMEIVHRTTEGKHPSVSISSYVHYDRMVQRVLSRSDMLIPGKDRELLSVINESISSMNSEKSESQYFSVSKLPAEMRVKDGGIEFVFAPSELGPSSPRELAVFVSNDKLEDFFTESFKELVEGNSNWTTLKRPF